MSSQPKFVPRPGQVDFTNIRWSPVINCVLEHNNRYLVVQRNKDMRLYPGYWNGISGFLDDNRNLEEKVADEISEELGISKADISNIRLGQIFDQDEPKYQKTWIVHPVHVQVTTDRIILDWEATNYKWATLEEIKLLDLLPGFDLVIRSLFPKKF